MCADPVGYPPIGSALVLGERALVAAVTAASRWVPAPKPEARRPMTLGADMIGDAGRGGGCW